jgi:hypothetical protein
VLSSSFLMTDTAAFAIVAFDNVIILDCALS